MLYRGADNFKNKPLMGISPRTTYERRALAHLNLSAASFKCYT